MPSAIEHLPHRRVFLPAFRKCVPVLAERAPVGGTNVVAGGGKRRGDQIARSKTCRITSGIQVNMPDNATETMTSR